MPGGGHVGRLSSPARQAMAPPSKVDVRLVAQEWAQAHRVGGTAETANSSSVTAHRTCTHPTHARTTLQELLGVRQALVARALDNSVVMEAGHSDVQLALRPLGSGLAHHQDVCASSATGERPTPALTLASNEACRAVPVRDRIPQLDKCRANAIEPSRPNGNWPTHHLRCTHAPSYCHHSCRHHRPPQRGGGPLRHFDLLSYSVVDRLWFLAGWDSATEVALPAHHLHFHTIRVAEMFRKIEREPVVCTRSGRLSAHAPEAVFQWVQGLGVGREIPGLLNASVPRASGLELFRSLQQVEMVDSAL